MGLSLLFDARFSFPPSIQAFSFRGHDAVSASFLFSFLRISSRLTHNFCNYYPQIPLSSLFPAYQCQTTLTTSNLRYPWMIIITRSWLPLDNIPTNPRPIIGIRGLAAKAPHFIFKQWHISGTSFATYHRTCSIPCVRVYEYTRQFRPPLRVFLDRDNWKNGWVIAREIVRRKGALIRGSSHLHSQSFLSPL